MYESRRAELTRRNCILGGVTLIVSLVAIVVGIITVLVSGSDFPYSAGAAMVGGIPSVLLATCTFYMMFEGSKSGNETTGCFDCCALSMVVWFSITILAICFAFGLGGIYGVVACTNPTEREKYCTSSADEKYALSVVTIIVTFVLFVLTLAIFFTCCCNSGVFGMPITADQLDYYSYRGSYGQSASRYSNSRRNQQEAPIENDLPEARRQNPRPRSPIENIRFESDITGSNIREPSAPSVSGTSQQIPEVLNVDIGPTSFEPSSDPGARYEDPPPSYDEVMRKEQAASETVV